MRKVTITKLKCVQCGADFDSVRTTSRYCSQKCRDKKRLVRPPVVRECARAECRAEFLVGKHHRYCSPLCRALFRETRPHLGNRRTSEAAILLRFGVIDACLIYYHTCVDCGVLMVTRTKRKGKWPCCRPCAAVRLIGTDSRRAHKRRASGPPVLSVHQLAERDGSRCHICHRKVDLNLSGMAKWGPTIEHIVPVSKGGTNEAHNLALAHRHCNTVRGNRGGSQLLLIA